MSDVVQLLTSAGVPVADENHHHVRPGWIGADCPHCSPGVGAYRLGFEIDTGRCNCWGCGPKNGVTLLMQMCNIDWQEAKAAFGQTVVRDRSRKVRAKRVIEPKGIGDLEPAHRQYLTRRGFSPDEIGGTWGVRGIGNGSDGDRRRGGHRRARPATWAGRPR